MWFWLGTGMGTLFVACVWFFIVFASHAIEFYKVKKNFLRILKREKNKFLKCWFFRESFVDSNGDLVYFSSLNRLDPDDYILDKILVSKRNRSFIEKKYPLVLKMRDGFEYQRKEIIFFEFSKKYSHIKYEVI